MKNIYATIQDFKRALRRNNVKKVFLYDFQFWFYTQKAVWVHQSKFVIEFISWLEEHKIEIDVRGEIR